MSDPANLDLPSRSPGDDEVYVLLVDDDPAILEGVTDLLEYHGFRVTTATDGRAALLHMEGRSPDLVISDIAMPGMDGYQFFEAVRSNPNWTAIPFIFLTARGQVNDVHTGYIMGVDDYVIKPFEPAELVIKVEARLKRSREIRASTQTEVDRMKQQLISIFSHELRTPLTYIYGYANLLQEDHPNLDEGTITQMLNGVTAGAERLVRLVEELLLVVRIDSGVVKTEVVHRSLPINLRPAVERLVNTFEPIAAARHITLTFQPQGEVVVMGVLPYLEQAVRSLIENAIKFSKKEDGHIEIGLEAQEDQAVLTVRDDGIGIAEADRERIFQRFEQINRHELEQQGLGLGLTITRYLIEFHKGSIEVHSEPGQGSHFTIRLPLVQTP